MNLRILVDYAGNKILQSSYIGWKNINGTMFGWEFWEDVSEVSLRDFHEQERELEKQYTESIERGELEEEVANSAILTSPVDKFKGSEFE